MKAGRMKAGSLNIMTRQIWAGSALGSRRAIGLWGLVGVTFMALTTSAYAQGRAPGFLILPASPNPPGRFFAATLSPDGKNVGGDGTPSYPQTDIDDLVAFTWTESTGYREAFTSEYDRSIVRGFSADGSTVIGTGHIPGTPTSNNDEPLRRVGNGPVERLGRLDPPRYSGEPTGVSADGNTIVVQLTDRATTGFSALTARWTPSTGLQLINTPAGFGFLDPATMTADGKTIACTVGNSSGSQYAATWKEGVGVQVLPSLSSFNISDAADITPDGRFIVGSSAGSDFSPHLVVWDRGVIKDLGIPNGAGAAGGQFISADGSVILGRAQYPDRNLQWFIWTQETGSVRFNEYLSMIGLSPPSWLDILGFSGLSDDGRTLSGLYGSPLGSGSFVITIPTVPAASFTVGLLLCHRRRLESRARRV